MLEPITARVGLGTDTRAGTIGSNFQSAIPRLPIAGMAVAADSAGLMAASHARELRRLTKGASGTDPRIAQLTRKLAVARAAATGLTFETARLEKMTEAVPEEGLLLHGHVLTVAGDPVAAVVSVLDANDRPVPDLKEAKTDTTGYFRFFVASRGSKVASKPAPAAQVRATETGGHSGATRKGQASAAPAPAEARTLALRVTDEQGKEIMQRDIVIVIPGVAVYRQLTQS